MSKFVYNDQIIGGGIPKGQVESILGNFAKEYDKNKTYSLGEYVIYDDLIYKCISKIETAEEFDNTKWKQTDYGEEISLLNKPDFDFSAKNTTYDNTDSGLESTNVQDAISENAENIKTLDDNQKVIGQNLDNHLDSNNPHNIGKSEVGLENVDNTSDIDKPVSTATQTALDLKANIESPTFTGTPTAPTAESGTNNTQIATTAFVQTVKQEAIETILGESVDTDFDTLREVADWIKSDTTNSAELITRISNVETEVENKQDTITGAASTVISDDLTFNRALISNSNGKIAVSDITTTELGYLGGVTSNIQTQLDDKAASSHTHSEYAAASHGTHVSYGTSASALGTSSAGTASTVSRSDHVHALPALTSCTGTLSVAKGGTGATDAATARTNLGITPGNIGALGTSGDSKSNTVTFTSGDVDDGSATAWTSVTKLASGITHATFFARVSQMFKNIRYLYKMLGTTDISTIGDGTVKGAISTINSNLADTTCVQLVSGQIDFEQYKYLDIVFQDLSINNGSITKRYYVWHNGSSYHDGYITYANDSIYIVKFTITFENGNVTLSNGYYNKLTENTIVDCTPPHIQAIFGHK